MPAIQANHVANWCRQCSPTGRAVGEPGAECQICGAPIAMTDLEQAETRTLRNAAFVGTTVPDELAPIFSLQPMSRYAARRLSTGCEGDSDCFTPVDSE